MSQDVPESSSGLTSEATVGSDDPSHTRAAARPTTGSAWTERENGKKDGECVGSTISTRGWAGASRRPSLPFLTHQLTCSVPRPLLVSLKEELQSDGGIKS